MCKLNFLLAVGLVWTLPVYAANLDFLVGDQIKQTAELSDLSTKVKPSGLVSRDPPHSTPVKYEGLALRAVLDVVYGEAWHRYDTIGFSSADGYTPTVPVQVIERTAGLIALNEAGRSGFGVIKQPNGEAIDPGPAYLVWDTAQATTNNDDDWLAWPWQLTRIALLQFSSLYPRSLPDRDSAAAIRNGFMVHQQHCVRCHRINSEGGTVGPELNIPVSVTEKYSREKLSQLLRDPRSVMPNSNMPALPMRNEQDKTRLNDLLDYLHYIAHHKQAAATP